jgi:hypothetical protein
MSYIGLNSVVDEAETRKECVPVFAGGLVYKIRVTENGWSRVRVSRLPPVDEENEDRHKLTAWTVLCNRRVRSASGVASATT